MQSSSEHTESEQTESSSAKEDIKSRSLTVSLTTENVIIW